MYQAAEMGEQCYLIPDPFGTQVTPSGGPDAGHGTAGFGRCAIRFLLGLAWFVIAVPLLPLCATVYWKQAVCFLFQRSSGFTDGLESQMRLELENGAGISKAHKALWNWIDCVCVNEIMRAWNYENKWEGHGFRVVRLGMGLTRSG